MAGWPNLSSPRHRLVRAEAKNSLGRGGWLLVDVRFRLPGAGP